MLFRSAGLFDMTTIGMLLDQHQAGERDYNAALWSLSMIEAFLRQVHGGAIRRDARAEAIGNVA